MNTTKSIMQSSRVSVEGGDSSRRNSITSITSNLTQDSIQGLKQCECSEVRRRHRLTSLFFLPSRKRSSSPLSPPKRWSFPLLFTRRRAIPRRRSYSSKTRRGFSTASLELELQNYSKRELFDLDLSSTSFALAGAMNSKSEGFLGLQS